MPKWVQEMIAGTNVVRPLDDIILHKKMTDCPCSPRVENIVFTCYHEGPKMAVAKQVIHNAMDGREDWDREEGDEG